MYDVIIIGGASAGLTAAMYAIPVNIITLTHLQPDNFAYSD
jgi:thioredoxin reductase